MPEETQGPLTTANADRDDALKRLEELEQRVKGAKEALRWQGEFILQWKKDGLDTTAAERLLPNLYRRLSAVEKKWIALREELGIPLAEATKPRSATPTVTVQAVGMRVERSYTRSPRCEIGVQRQFTLPTDNGLFAGSSAHVNASGASCCQRLTRPAIAAPRIGASQNNQSCAM